MLGVAAQRQHWHVTLDARRPRVDPVRHELGVVTVVTGAALPRAVEKRLPHIIGWLPSEDVGTTGAGDVLAHRVTLVAVHAPLALLEVDRVRRQVPVHDGVTVKVEVETLLSLSLIHISEPTRRT